MGIIGGEIGYRILRRISRDGNTGYMDGSVHKGRSKLETLLGTHIWEQIKGRTVLDFGCGQGSEVVELAQRGAYHVIGIDIQEHHLSRGRAAAKEAGVSDKCEFAAKTGKRVDVIISLDAFEHFDDPADILVKMHGLLAPNGRVIASFGPTWYHPLGGHLFSVFPWAHLIFSEKSLIRWRSDFKNDGATRFGEVAGGLNKITIQRFTQIVNSSPFDIEKMELVPIRQLKSIASYISREWTTAVVRVTLKLKPVALSMNPSDSRRK